MRRRVKIPLIGVVTLGLLVVCLALLVTNSDWGRERVRRQVLAILRDQVNGRVEIGAVHGNLLTGATLVDVAITDSAGQPFVVADTLQAAYGLRALLGQRIHLSDVRLVHALVVLDRRPGDEWNFVKLFRGDTTAPQDTTTAPGWGDWINVEDLRIVDSHVIVRMPWEPDSTLVGAARDSAIRDAVHGGGRLNVVEVEEGWQTIYELRSLYAVLPVLRIADPELEARHFEIDSLRAEAYPFRPPAAEIRDLAAVVDVAEDSMWFSASRLVLPGSRLRGRGALGFPSNSVELVLEADTTALGDLRWLYPRLPADGGGRMDFRLVMRGDTMNYVVRDASLRTSGATLDGDLALVFLGDTVGFEESDVRFTGVDTRLLERLVPDLEVPLRGTASGRATLDGTLRRLRVDADVVFDGEGAGRSQVLAEGIVGMTDGVVAADGLRVELRPLQVALARAFAPDLPVGGTVSGSAVLDGSTDQLLRARMDLVHADGDARSHVTGTTAVRTTPATWLDADVRLEPLALAAVGRFAPAAQLRGSLAGPVRVQGALGDLRLAAALALSGGGELGVNGRLDLDGPAPGYDLQADLRLFDASAVTGLAPPTTVTGRAHARGRGTDPATMRATLVADLAASRVNDATVDSLRARVAVADGLATVDTLLVRGPGTTAAAAGSLGLVAGRRGTLRFDVDVDSLAAFASWIRGTDTSRVAPRPLVIAREVARARADSIRIAEETAVERMATGGGAVALAPVDTAPSIRRDSVAGALYLAGELRGNLDSLDADARLGAQGLAARGSTVRQARAELSVRGALGERPLLSARAHLDTVVAEGFLLDSVNAHVTYQDGSGVATLGIVQNERSDYQLRAEYRLALDDRELRLQESAFRFDSLTWRSTQPGVVRWNARRVAVENVDLLGGEGRRIFVDGEVPLEGGDANLELLVRGFQLSSLTQLLQSDIQARGDLTVTARLTGSAEAPRISGALGLVEGEYEGNPVPALRATFGYEKERAEIRFEGLNARGAQIFRGEAVVPVNLAINTTAARLPDAPLAGGLDADSLPLGLIPAFTDAITEADGAAHAAVRVGGTVRAPRIAGALALDGGRIRLAATGATINNLTARIRLTQDTVIVDSLLGYAGGPIRLVGGIGIDTITRPAFDLYLVAENARLLADARGELRVDAELAMRGPYDGVYVNGTSRIRSGVFVLPPLSDKEVIAADDPALFAVVDTTVASEAELAPTRNELLENLRVDVLLTVARDTWVRSREANVELFTPEESGPLEFSLDQRQRRLVLEGVVSTERGEYTFMGRRFELQRGSVIFIGTPDLNPTLQLTGQRTVRLTGQAPMNIRVLIGGTMRSPRISLESDAQPPLSQSDLLSYLAFGQSSGSLLQLQGSGLAGSTASGGLVGAAAAAGSSQLVSIALNLLVEETEQAGTERLGLDVLNITPAPLPLEAFSFTSGGSNLSAFVRGTEVEAGWYLNRNTFFSMTVRPSLLAPRPDDRFYPGFRVEHRFGTGYTLNADFGGEYFPQPPTLRRADRQNVSPRQTFGLFLTREWRW